MRDLLRSPLTWVVGACVLAIFASLSWLGAELRAQNRAVAAKFTEDLASSITAQIFERYSDSQALALNPAVLNLLQAPSAEAEKTAGAVLEEFIRLYVVYSKVIISDARGKVILARADHAQPAIPATRSFTDEDSGFPTNIATPDPGMLRAHEFQTFRSAIRDARGELRGWVENVASTLYLDRELIRTLKQNLWPREIPLRLHVLDEQSRRLVSVIGGAIEYPRVRTVGVPSWDIGRVAVFDAPITDARLRNPLRWEVVFEIPEQMLFESVLQIERVLYGINFVIIFTGIMAVVWLYRTRRKHQREIAEQVLSAQEAEKARISREIHDDVGQNLSAAKLWLARLHEGIPPEKVGIYDEIRDIIETTNDSLRRISLALHPSLIQNLGLEAAVRWKIDNAAKASGFEGVYTNAGVALEKLPRPAQIHVFRFVQEAIQNIQKHAKACKVYVRVWEDRDRVHVSIVDDGEGLRGTRKGIGFFSMDERAQALDGRVRVDSPLSAQTRREHGISGDFAGTCVHLEFSKKQMSQGGIRENDLNC